MTSQIAATVAIIALLSLIISAKMDSPFPNVVTSWTYAAFVSLVALAVSGFALALSLIWGF